MIPVGESHAHGDASSLYARASASAFSRRRPRSPSYVVSTACINQF